MPRPRTGSLSYRRSTGWNARVWVNVKDATTGELREERQWIPLNTHDRDLAKRKLGKIVSHVAAGEVIADATEKATRVEIVIEAKEAFIVRRKAAGVVMATDEEHWLDEYVLPQIGKLPVTKVRTRDIKIILNDAVPTLSRESIRKLRGTMTRMFHWLWEQEIIPENPVARAPVPEEARVDERPRTMLTDEQVRTFLDARPGVHKAGEKLRKDAETRLLELKMMAVCSRVFGGLRTAEVNRWTWDLLLDPEAPAQSFERVRVRRAKAKRGRAGKVQTFIVPEPMRPILRTWYELADRPIAGPVFPVMKGERTGQHRKERGTSYAYRLRRELLRMGIDDHAIHNDTETTKKVDFHSFRRAFASALAAADIGEQRAMRLTSHTDSRVHARYVMETEAMRTIPAAAIPRLPAAGFGTRVPIREPHDPAGPPSLGKEARPVRFELTTFGFEGRRVQGTCESLRDVAWCERAGDADERTRCCVVSRCEKAPAGA